MLAPYLHVWGGVGGDFVSFLLFRFFFFCTRCFPDMLNMSSLGDTGYAMIGVWTPQGSVYKTAYLCSFTSRLSSLPLIYSPSLHLLYCCWHLQIKDKFCFMMRVAISLPLLLFLLNFVCLWVNIRRNCSTGRDYLAQSVCPLEVYQHHFPALHCFLNPCVCHKAFIWLLNPVMLSAMIDFLDNVLSVHYGL